MGEQQDLQMTYRSTTYLIVKWVLILLIVANILSSIWVGIHMNNAIERIKSKSERNYLDPFRNNDRNLNNKIEVWKGVIITLLVLTDIACLVGIFGAFKEHYCLVMVFGVVMLVYSVFSAASDYTRSSISSWAVSFSTGIVACLFGHKIRVEVIHPTIYSVPFSD